MQGGGKRGRAGGPTIEEKLSYLQHKLVSARGLVPQLNLPLFQSLVVEIDALITRMGQATDGCYIKTTLGQLAPDRVLQLRERLKNPQLSDRTMHSIIGWFFVEVTVIDRLMEGLEQLKEVVVDLFHIQMARAFYSPTKGGEIQFAMFRALVAERANVVEIIAAHVSGMTDV